MPKKLEKTEVPKKSEKAEVPKKPIDKYVQTAEATRLEVLKEYKDGILRLACVAPNLDLLERFKQQSGFLQTPITSRELVQAFNTNIGAFDRVMNEVTDYLINQESYTTSTREFRNLYDTFVKSTITNIQSITEHSSRQLNSEYLFS